MRKVFCLLVFGLMLATIATAQTGTSHFDGNSWWAHVKFLADDSLEGPFISTRGTHSSAGVNAPQLRRGLGR